jgi:biopolymer transport protein ExbD
MRNSSDETMADMNTTPLIDVMLVLLTLLIITLPLQTHAVKINVQQTPSLAPPPPSITLGVDFDGTLSWNGAPVPAGSIDTYLANAAAQDPQPDIKLHVDHLARYDRVAKLLADAQRLGIKHIGFDGTEDYGR